MAKHIFERKWCCTSLRDLIKDLITDEIDKRKSPAPCRIQTHDLFVTRRGSTDVLQPPPRFKCWKLFRRWKNEKNLLSWFFFRRNLLIDKKLEFFFRWPTNFFWEMDGSAPNERNLIGKVIKDVYCRISLLKKMAPKFSGGSDLILMKKRCCCWSVISLPTQSYW